MANTIGVRAKSNITATAFIGAGVLQIASGSHTFVAASAAADTFDACKIPGRATVVRATVLVDGVAAAAADVTLGYVGAPSAFTGMKGPVTLNSNADVIVRATSVGAADFPAGAVVTVMVEYTYDSPVS